MRHADDNQRLRQAVRVGNIGIFEHDHTSNEIYWSTVLRQTYGWDEEEPATLPKILSHVYPADAARVIAAVKRAHDPDGDGLFDIEHRILDRKGEVHWVQTRSQTYFTVGPSERKPTRTIGAVQDITERRLAEGRLHILNAVLRSSAQAMAIADAQGLLTFANAALSSLYGYAAGESLLGLSMFEFWRTEDAPATALELLSGRGLQRLEIPAARRDGSHFFLELTIEPIAQADGESTQVLLTFTDITERKRLEADLMHAQRIESIGRLAGGVAHDFNNMLTVISGALEVAASALPPEHACLTHLGDAAQAARSAAALTRQLLAFSRKGPVTPANLSLNAIIHGMQRIIARLMGEDVQLTLDLGSELPSVRFDPSHAEQLVLNLATNARDAMPRGGRLTIQTSAVDVAPAEPGDEPAPRPRRFVMLAVRDEGTGMTEEVRAHLFEPFFTTKAAGKGTGLGLSTVYGAVRQGGGHIEVESSLGAGTLFKVFLPAVGSSASLA